MKLLNPIATTIALALASSTAMAADFNLEVVSKAHSGAPSFVKGNLGKMTQKTSVASLKSIIASAPSFKSNGNEEFAVKRQWIDRLGMQHAQMKQTLNGLEVFGTSMTVHADANGDIYAVSGKLAVKDGAKPDLKAMSSNIISLSKAVRMAKDLGDMIERPRLAYVYLPQLNKTALVWKTEIKWDKAQNDFGHDAIFLDVESGEVLARHAKMHQAKSWKTYDIQNLSESSVGPSTAPGVLLCTNTGSCGSDSSAQRAHDGASSVYDFYKDRFGRNSVNGSDLTLTSSVHVGNNYANAFWYNGRMWYGDGDGQQFHDLTLAHDVIGHELTHGVVEYSAGLVYQNASGALNEGFADIMGAASDAYKNNSTQPDWKIGEEVMVNGSALRFMNNPTADGYSTDWFPDRIPFTNNPTSSNDYGGVHGNSGIANLAFVLLTDGGTHPRGKSSENVPGIGLAKSEQIFYRALTTYMNSSTDFDGARTATKQAATDLYGATEASAVESAWCAVGVGSCPSGGGGTTPPTGNDVLENGVAKTGLSASTGSDLTFTLEVPAGATDISFTMSGGTGDADLYVRKGAAPTDSTYDCRPYKTGNSESCTGTGDGTYHVRLKAYSAFTGVSLTGSFTAPSTGGGLDPIDTTVNNVSVGRRAYQRYTLDLAAGYSTFTVTTSGGSGDADLYLRLGANATTSTYDCRSWASGNTETCTINNPGAGTWHIDLYGYSAASGITLNAQATP